MKIYLTRHGETEWNIEGRIQSHGDSPLTSKGIETSKQLGHKLSNVKFDEIYSSDLGRAMETAKIIRGNREIEITRLIGIREIDLEPWRGKYFNELDNNDRELNNRLYNSPNKYSHSEGESYHNFYCRVSKTIDAILNYNNSRNILVVSHFHTIRAILSYLKNIPIEDIPKEFPSIANNEVIIIEVINGKIEK